MPAAGLRMAGQLKQGSNLLAAHVFRQKKKMLEFRKMKNT
jgi:hypothetical protein